MPKYENLVGRMILELDVACCNLIKNPNFYQTGMNCMSNQVFIDSFRKQYDAYLLFALFLVYKRNIGVDIFGSGACSDVS